MFCSHLQEYTLLSQGFIQAPFWWGDFPLQTLGLPHPKTFWPGL